MPIKNNKLISIVNEVPELRESVIISEVKEIPLVNMDLKPEGMPFIPRDSSSAFGETN